MKTIINNLFHQIGLISKELNFGELHFFENENKYSYWLVIETENLTEVIDKQSDYFNIAKEVANNEWFDKNVSMIIIHKVENFDNIQNLVLEVEENPYRRPKLFWINFPIFIFSLNNCFYFFSFHK